MKRMVLSLFLPLVLAPLGCDRDDDDADVADARAAGPTADGHAAFGKHSPVDKLCALVSCSDEQREEILALLPAPPPRERPDDSKRDAANAALADAFRSDAFSAAAVVGWRTAVHDGEKRPRPSTESIVGIHGVLEASQRDTLADVLEARGPGALFGKGGKHGGKHGKKGKDGAKKGDKAERFAADLCERVDCHDDQAQAIATAFAQSKPSRDRDAAADAAFAVAFRADKLATATVNAYLAGLEQRHEKDAALRDAAIVEIHRLLDAEQRGVLADEIGDHGLRAIMPERGHHGRGGKHKDGERKSAPA